MRITKLNKFGNWWKCSNCDEMIFIPFCNLNREQYFIKYCPHCRSLIDSINGQIICTEDSEIGTADITLI